MEKGRGGNTRLGKKLSEGHLRSGLGSSSANPAAFPMNSHFLRICIHVRAIQSASYHERRYSNRTLLSCSIFSGLPQIQAFWLTFRHCDAREVKHFLLDRAGWD